MTSKKTAKRKSINITTKRAVWNKTGGYCHFCGRVLRFDAKAGEKGRWHIDHTVPVARKGKDKLNNLLSICSVCNRLKWYLRGRKIRKTFHLGVVALREYKRGSKLGKEIHRLYQKQLKQNKSRRKRDFPDRYYR